MNPLIALAWLLASAAVAVPVIRTLVRDLTRDGMGGRPAPRSHREEVGSWSTQQLQR